MPLNDDAYDAHILAYEAEQDAAAARQEEETSPFAPGQESDRARWCVEYLPVLYADQRRRAERRSGEERRAG